MPILSISQMHSISTQKMAPFLNPTSYIDYLSDKIVCLSFVYNMIYKKCKRWESNPLPQWEQILGLPLYRPAPFTNYAITLWLRTELANHRNFLQGGFNPISPSHWTVDCCMNDGNVSWNSKEPWIQVMQIIGWLAWLEAPPFLACPHWPSPAPWSCTSVSPISPCRPNAACSGCDSLWYFFDAFSYD